VISGRSERLAGGAFTVQAFVIDPSVGFGLAATSGLAVLVGY